MRVRQIDNVLDLFEVFARERSPLTLTALSELLDTPKSSTFNVIETLASRGFLYETKPRGGYYPTQRMLELSRLTMDGDPLTARLHGQLEALALATGETAVLSVRDQQDVVYVDVVECTAPIRYFARVGERRALQTTSSGKAILASYPSAERDRILRTLRYQPGPESKGPSDLSAEIEAAEARGWCEDLGESTADVLGVGVPVVTAGRRYGLAVAGPIYRMLGRREELAAHLRAAAGRISAM